MTKFLDWMNRNRKQIGYTVGVLNMLVALNHYIQGQSGLAALWFVIGVMFIWDAADSK